MAKKNTSKVEDEEYEDLNVPDLPKEPVEDLPDYQILPEEQIFQKKIKIEDNMHFNFERLSKAAALGDPVAFQNLTRLNDAFLEAFKDDSFQARLKKIDNSFNDVLNQIHDDDSPKQTKQLLVQQAQFEKCIEEIKNHVKLLGRKKKL